MSERELNPRQQEEVRRLLAEARHTEPMPEDVATRIDDVLEGLSSERSAAPIDVVDSAGAPQTHVPAASGDELGARRRRRLATGLLAAAAVIVAGFTLPSVLPSGTDVSAEESGSEQKAELDDLRAGAPESGDSDSLDDAGSPEAATGDPPGLREAPGRNRLDAVALVTARAFGADVRSVVAEASTQLRVGRPVISADWCTVRDSWGAGEVYPVQYATPDQNRRAVLVVRPARDGVRIAALFVCGQDAAARRTTLPAE